MTPTEHQQLQASFRRHGITDPFVDDLAGSYEHIAFEKIARCMKYLLREDLVKRSGISLEQLINNVWSWLRYE